MVGIQLSLFLVFCVMGGNALYCRRPVGLTNKFCANPPVVPVDRAAYTGTWYQAYVDDNALRFSKPNCVTANYTLRQDGSIGVLNCYSNNKTVGAQCSVARARPRPNSDSTGRLLVKFRGSPFPEGSYNVAHLLGSKSYGYSAAAIFSCNTFRGRRGPSWFFIVRDPYFAALATRRLIRILRCKGYSFRGVKLYPTYQGNKCKYFYGMNGFKINMNRNRNSMNSLPMPVM